MTHSFPSIFNDVIGPIMRGPSSSHTAASWRVAKMGIQMLGHKLKNAIIEFDKDGQWATNYEEQGTVLGMNGGLLNLEMEDPAMKDTSSLAEEKGIKIEYKISSFKNDHANSMLLHLYDHKDDHVTILAASLGGGSFEIREIDGLPLKSKGDQYELLIWSKSPNLKEELANWKPPTSILTHAKGENKSIYRFKSPNDFSETLFQSLHSFHEIDKIARLNPVMPVISGREKELPWKSLDQLIEYGNQEKLSLGEMGKIYEQRRSGQSFDDISQKMQHLIDIIDGSIDIGLKGTEYKDRILPQQSNLIDKAEQKGKILQGSIINKIVKYVAAIMESKSALELVVANPTAGSCGTVGAALKAVSEELKSNKNEILNAYFAAGLIGAYFAMGPGFSAEEHGCQVECGAAAGMAAAGIVELFGGSPEQALGAASMAIQNMIGLVCDPIADRVEAPCLGKNTSAAVNALSSATMASSGFAYLIPLDQVLETVERVSSQMPSCNKCTGLGGLAITPAALKIKSELSKKQ